ncbi:ribosomal protein S1, mitochondrial-like [Salvia miltiorrhiza]|uniref:ribosomal protein S1, mitochondrial-like n=1 Tax=Salvia miltiorrhiza TaxID=226208 RepID=UPI0025AB9D49|nr:ribosomal protein S1, mitochondrial-like [Salvia miltiorrhiza]
MSVYMSRLFPKSNSSFFLQSGNALKAKAVRLREDTYLIDAGVGRPRTALPNELIDPPKSAGPAAFSTKVGFLNPTRGESTVKNSLLQRCFVDLVTGDSRTKQHAAARFDDMVGQTDAACGGEQPLLLPRSFRKQRAWTELQHKWKFNRKVKGFIAGKVRGGYSVGIAGYLAFLPARNIYNRRADGDRFVIENLSPRNLVVTKVG